MGPWACALPVISCKVVSILVFSVCLHAFDFLILRKIYKKAHSHSDPDSFIRVLYYIGDLERDLDFRELPGNYPYTILGTWSLRAAYLAPDLQNQDLGQPLPRLAANEN